MKVLLINGSPHERGCTYTALRAVAEQLENNGIETEIFHIGHDPIRGCAGCGYCRKNHTGKCVYDVDCVNIALEKAADADGFVFGSPVHYAAASGGITSFLDRFFYSGSPGVFDCKPGAAVVTCRRAGATAALEQLNKYFSILNMPIITSRYWNIVHGNTPEEVLQDLEGMQVMRTLGRNMAWLLKSIEAGKKAGLPPPEREEKIHINFIR